MFFSHEADPVLEVTDESMRFNAPPNWPRPPAGWTPPPGWTPDPAWGPAPTDWRYWGAPTRQPMIETADPNFDPSRTHTMQAPIVAIILIGVVIITHVAAFQASFWLGASLRSTPHAIEAVADILGVVAVAVWILGSRASRSRAKSATLLVICGLVLATTYLTGVTGIDVAARFARTRTDFAVDPAGSYPLAHIALYSVVSALVFFAWGLARRTGRTWMLGVPAVVLGSAVWQFLFARVLALASDAVFPNAPRAVSFAIAESIWITLVDVVWCVTVIVVPICCAAAINTAPRRDR